MKLLPNEVELLKSNDDAIILTNFRIQMTDKIWGQAFSIIIFLQDISSIETKFKSNILFLVLGAITAIGGFSIGEEAEMAGLLLGGIFVAIWWFTRKHIVSISSNGGASLNFMVQGMSSEKINDFIHNVSLAKQNRIIELHKL